MTGGEVCGHGDPRMRALSPGEWVRAAFGLDPPARQRQCMFRSAFPCNGHCWMEHRCMVAEAVRRDDVGRN